tara:strand:- start:1 stop:2460 length:2460 start_codon:yes stop_codon:yes gene_type:complete
MSFDDCIVNGNKETDADGKKLITDEQAQTAKDLFAKLDAEYQGKMSRGAAQAQAAKDAFDILKREAYEKRRKKLLQATVFKQIEKNLSEYRDISGKKNVGRASLALIEHDTLSKFSSLEQRKDAVHQVATSILNDVLASFRRNLVGEVRNKATQKNMVRELFGENTGDVSAREFAQAWQAASEYLRLERNKAGGTTAKRVDWGMPQNWDQLAVSKVTPEQFINDIIDDLNFEKMVDERSGLKFTKESVRPALRDVYETISTGGVNKLSTNMASRTKSLANRRTDHRFLVFKNPNGWIKAMEKYGEANPFDTMMGHISVMSKEIAQMQILGPNPSSTIEYLKVKIRQDPNSSESAGKNLDTLYGASIGRNNVPVNGFIANTFAGLANILQSAQLGSAAVAALTDVNFQRIARQFAGLPQTTIIKDYLRILNPLKAEEQGKLSIRLNLIAEGWTSIASGQMRYVGDISGPEITRRISDFIMRASFLSPYTQAGRWAFGQEFLGFMGDQAGKKFDELDVPLRNTFEQYGIGSDKWDIIRSTKLYNHKGAEFVDIQGIRQRTDIDANTARELSLRVSEMINTETNFAVPSSSLRGRTALIGDAQPGTISGTLLRSFAMYKNFGVTLVNTHIMRGITAQGAKRKGMYLADFLISSAVMGGLALQLKEMSKGRDPRPMNDVRFWGPAFLQGGGLGIFGDFLFANENGYGDGLAKSVAGPVVGFGSDVANIAIGNIAALAKGEDTKVASDMIRFAGRYTPGSSLWYSRLAMERLVVDQAQIWANPKARSSMRRTVNNYRRNYQQNYWWKPGRTSPTRSPNLDNAMR